MKPKKLFSLSRFLKSFELDSADITNILLKNGVNSIHDLQIKLNNALNSKSSNVAYDTFELDIEFISNKNILNPEYQKTFEWTIQPSRFGNLFIIISEKRIFYIGFFDEKDEKTSTEKHHNFLRNILKTNTLNLHPISDNSLVIIQNYIKLMEGERNIKNNKINITLIASDFQRKVWQALVNVPKGQLSSYSEIASKCDTPRASRAVGTAIGQNPICILIPCHRIITSDGRVGGYSNGVKNKLMLLCNELK